MKHLKQYSQFATREQMDFAIMMHMKTCGKKFSKSTIKIKDFMARMSSYNTHPGVCRLKIDTIAAENDVNRRTVERAIKFMEDIGMMKRISQINPKRKGKASNIYVFQRFVKKEVVSNMSDRPEAEKPITEEIPASTKSTEANIGQSTYKISNKEYVPNQRSKEKLPWYIPKELAKAFSVGFKQVSDIKEIYKRFVMFKKSEGIVNNEFIMPIALQAWEYTINAYRTSNRHWLIDRFCQCFYGTMKKIYDVQIKAMCADW
ncbi:hypothetical protein ABE354_08785 [Brevibacillus laterosporus]|uniref:hypothetical protein n=1 Tax=Brevibacillus laterosporus TaxID=1465 RepID=UPI003D19A3B4